MGHKYNLPVLYFQWPFPTSVTRSNILCVQLCFIYLIVSAVPNFFMQNECRSSIAIDNVWEGSLLNARVELELYVELQCPRPHPSSMCVLF